MDTVKRGLEREGEEEPVLIFSAKSFQPAETLSYILLDFFLPFIFQDRLCNWPFSRGNDTDYFFMMAALL